MSYCPQNVRNATKESNVSDWWCCKVTDQRRVDDAPELAWWQQENKQPLSLIAGNININLSSSGLNQIILWLVLCYEQETQLNFIYKALYKQPQLFCISRKHDNNNWKICTSIKLIPKHWAELLVYLLLTEVIRNWLLFNQSREQSN